MEDEDEVDEEDEDDEEEEEEEEGEEEGEGMTVSSGYRSDVESSETQLESSLDGTPHSKPPLRMVSAPRISHPDVCLDTVSSYTAIMSITMVSTSSGGIGSTSSDDGETETDEDLDERGMQALILNLPAPEQFWPQTMPWNDVKQRHFWRTDYHAWWGPGRAQVRNPARKGGTEDHPDLSGGRAQGLSVTIYKADGEDEEPPSQPSSEGTANETGEHGKGI